MLDFGKLRPGQYVSLSWEDERGLMIDDVIILNVDKERLHFVHGSKPKFISIKSVWNCEPCTKEIIE